MHGIDPVSNLNRSSDAADRLRIAVGIATIGRPKVLCETVERLSGQTRAPDAIVVCAPCPDDVEGVAEGRPDVTFIQGPRGLCSQRNAIIDYLAECDILVFFDDDFVPCKEYLATLESIMLRSPDIVLTTGHVLEDGIGGPGLSFEEADVALAKTIGQSVTEGRSVEVTNGYGCNMALRMDAVREHNVRFDETLPLYGWLEDVDFGQQLARYGRVVKTEATRGVHLGIKSGRQPQMKLGYSQIANPIYLSAKGTCPWRRSLFMISRNVAANVIGSIRPEPWIDRRGRLTGNLRAIADFFLGRMDPQRILSLD